MYKHKLGKYIHPLKVAIHNRWKYAEKILEFVSKIKVMIYQLARCTIPFSSDWDWDFEAMTTDSSKCK